MIKEVGDGECRTLVEHKGKNAWIIIEAHGKNCKCSYCGGMSGGKLHYGLNLPTPLFSCGWWVVKYWRGRYFRATIRWYKLKIRHASKRVI